MYSLCFGGREYSVGCLQSFQELNWEVLFSPSGIGQITFYFFTFFFFLVSTSTLTNIWLLFRCLQLLPICRQLIFLAQFLENYSIISVWRSCKRKKERFFPCLHLHEHHTSGHHSLRPCQHLKNTILHSKCKSSLFSIDTHRTCPTLLFYLLPSFPSSLSIKCPCSVLFLPLLSLQPPSVSCKIDVKLGISPKILWSKYILSKLFG